MHSIDIAKRFCNNLSLEYLPFKTDNICGILYKGKNQTSIALNRSRSEQQHNFDCAHELIHYFAHEINSCKCVCAESGTITQDSGMEYQANEGAAELLIPYQHFIPNIAGLYCDGLSSNDIDTIIIDLANEYFVSESVISIRLQSLKYEIYQYINGSNIDDLNIISNSRQKQLGINVKSIIDIRNYKRAAEEFGIPVDMDEYFSGT